MDGLTFNTARVATDSIRGYVYQIYQSIYAWINLQEDEILFLERAEDFDIEQEDSISTVQIKDTQKSGNITLRTQGCIDALNNYWELATNNPNKRIRLRYLTTSNPGVEQGSVLKEPSEGLKYWNRASRDADTPTHPLRNLLKDLKLSDALKLFVCESSDEEFRIKLIQPIHWDTGREDTIALQELVQEELILHGNRLKISPHYSRQAIGHLLKTVVDMIIADSDRKLSKVAFLKAFEEATCELVPRGSHHSLPHPAIYPFGTTESGYNLFQPMLTPPIPPVKGAVERSALNAELVQLLKQNQLLFLVGSTGMGKTTVATQLSNNAGGPWLWACLRGVSPPQLSNALKQIFFEIRNYPDLSLVIDDIDLNNSHVFDRELALIIFSVLQNGKYVILTSHHIPSGGLLRTIWRSHEAIYQIPCLVDEDIKNLLLKYEIPSLDKIDTFCKIIMATTGGHPQLAHARIYNLSRQGWPVPTYDMILNLEDIQKEKESIRLRIINEIPNENAKVILNIVSMFGCSFTRDAALEAAGYYSHILNPGESFDILVGPWIEKINSDEFRISPLVSDVGQKNIPSSYRSNVHEHLCKTILKINNLGILHVSAALLHALTANTEGALYHIILLIPSFSNHSFTLVAKYVAWFTLVKTDANQKICSSNDFIDASLRLMQLIVAIACSEHDKIRHAYMLLMKSISDIEQKDKQNEIYAISYMSVLNNLDSRIPARISIESFAGLIDCASASPIIDTCINDCTDIFPDGDSFPRTAYQAFAGMIAHRVSGASYFLELLDAIDDLDESKRSILFLITGELDFSNAICSRAWFEDIKFGNFDIDRSVNSLKKAIMYGEKWSESGLIVSAAVNISIVQDEYGNSFEQAKETLDNLEEHLRSNGFVQYQYGKIYFRQKNYAMANKCFCAAITSGDLSSLNLIFVNRHAGIAQAKSNDWSLAEHYFTNSLQLAKTRKTMTALAVGLTAEIAHTAWMRGDKKVCLSRLAWCLDALANIPSDGNLPEKKVHAVVRHFLGWLYVEPHPDEELMARLEAGMFSDLEAHPDFEKFKLTTIENAWGMLCRLDDKWNTSLNIFQNRFNGESRQLSALFQINHAIECFKKTWSKQQIENAIPDILVIIVAIHTLRDFDKNEMLSIDDIKLPEASDCDWKDNNNILILIDFLTVLIIKSLNSFETPNLLYRRWQADLSAYGIQNQQLDMFWATIDCPRPCQTRIYPTSPDKALQLLACENITPSEVLISHFRLFEFVNQGYFRDCCGEELSRFVAETWLTIAQTQQFSLIAPALHCPLIIEACLDESKTGCPKVARILDLAIDATGTRFTPEAREIIRNVQR